MKFLRTHGALLLVNLIYGANFTIAKQVMPRFLEPYAFIILRVSTALFLYLLIHKLFFKSKIDWKEDWKRFALCGFFGIAFNQLMFFKGLSMTTPINGSLLMIITPIFVIIFSSLLHQESLMWNKIVGTMLGTSGAFLLIGGKQFNFSSETAMGDLCIVLNALSYAVYLVIVRPLMHKYNPFTVITYVFLCGYPWVLMVGSRQLFQVEWSSIPSQYYWHIAFILICATALVYFLNLMAMRETSSTVVGNYIYTQPFFAVIIALLSNNDFLSWIKIASGMMIILGVYLTGLNLKKKAT